MTMEQVLVIFPNYAQVEFNILQVDVTKPNETNDGQVNKRRSRRELKSPQFVEALPEKITVIRFQPNSI